MFQTTECVIIGYDHCNSPINLCIHSGLAKSGATVLVAKLFDGISFSPTHTCVGQCQVGLLRPFPRAL